MFKKKYGVVLLLIMAVGGFSMSAVSAVPFNENYNLTVGGHVNITVYCGHYDEPIGDALDYVDVITHHPQRTGSHILEFVGKKVTPEGKPAQFRIYRPWYHYDALILSFEVKE
jgi:hypothetical protein